LIYFNYIYAYIFIFFYLQLQNIFKKTCIYIFLEEKNIFPVTMHSHISSYNNKDFINLILQRHIPTNHLEFRLSIRQSTKTLFVCWKVVFFLKVNSRKVNYFSMFGSVMENKLENTFQCLVMS
jgi:cytochrome c oxidase subunit IV